MPPRRLRRCNWSSITALFLIFMFVFQYTEKDRPEYVVDDAVTSSVKKTRTIDRIFKPVSYDDNNNNTDFMLKVFASRQKRIRDACLLDGRGNVQKLLMYRPVNLTYCVVPKAGCTYWKRIFRFLNGDTGSKSVSSPYEINRMVAHYGQYKQMGNIAFKNQTDRNDIAKTTRFLVARDPYSRLWAVYLDKFLLPDFWRSHGQVIAKQKMSTSQQIAQSKTGTQICTSNITFEDFVRYAINVESRGYGSNEHWVPISKLCNPCQYQPDYVVAMETFGRDSKFILQKAGLQKILDLQPKSHDHDELTMLIKYNFQLLGVKFYKNCISALDLCKRLWTVFQHNGYISSKTPFPELLGFKPSLVTKSMCQESVLKAVENNKVSRAERKTQKQVAMETAYQKLPMSIVRLIPYIYEHDFRLFGYNPYPYNIFKNYDKFKYLAAM